VTKPFAYLASDTHQIVQPNPVLVSPSVLADGVLPRTIHTILWLAANRTIFKQTHNAQKIYNNSFWPF